MKQQKKKCGTCYGYGMWPFGRVAPLGRIDASEMRGFAKKCPECGAGDVE